MEDTSYVLRGASEVIDALGGNGPVGELTNAAPKAVSAWRKNGLPPDTFVVLSAELAKRGLRAPASLWNMRCVS